MMFLLLTLCSESTGGGFIKQERWIRFMFQYVEILSWTFAGTIVGAAVKTKST